MNEAGDRRESGRRWDAAESQPISMTERALVARIYALFDCFYDQLSEEHEQMRRARMLRARRPDEQSRTAPTGNTLGSCVDNMIADQMDNLPEAGDAAGTGRDGEKRRRDGRRGELCTLPRGMAGQVSDADGGRHRDGYGGGAGFLGRRHGRRRRHGQRAGVAPGRLLPRSDVRGHAGWAGLLQGDAHKRGLGGAALSTGERLCDGRRIREGGSGRQADAGRRHAGDAAGILVQAIRRGDEADARSHGSGRGAGAAVQHGNGLRRGAGRIPKGCMRTENIRSCSTNTATRGESRSARG